MRSGRVRLRASIYGTITAQISPVLLAMAKNLAGGLTSCIAALLVAGCGGGESAVPSPPDLGALPALALSDSNRASAASEAFLALADFTFSFAVGSIELMDLYEDSLHTVNDCRSDG